jgi:hypothetical protein
MTSDWIEVIKLCTAVVGFLTVSVIFFVKINNVKKAIVNIVKSEMKPFADKLDYLTEIHQDKPKLGVIIRKLEEIIDDLTDGKNKEINRILLNALEKIHPVFDDIFETQFKEINKTKFIKIIKRKASSLRTGIDFRNLDFIPAYSEEEREEYYNHENGEAEYENTRMLILKKKSLKFIEDIKTSIDSDIILFCNQLEEISKEKKNGERVKAFETITKTLITNVTTKVINIHTSLSTNN